MAVSSQKSTSGKILKWLVIAMAVLLVLGMAVWRYIKSEMPKHTRVATTAPTTIKPTDDLALASIRKGLAYLKLYQEQDGHFVAGRLAPKPAFTALVVNAFLSSPDEYSVEKDAFLRKAVDAIVSDQKDTGSIHSDIPGMSFSSYSTSVALLALNKVKDPKCKPVIAKAAAYLKNDQHPVGTVNEGGFGYGNGSRADLNNTCTILEALEASGVEKIDPVWEKSQKFISRCQNRSESNDQDWAEDDGGFIYCPLGMEKGKLGRDGNPMNASYGTMSYAGLISFLYANVGKNDPRVKSAYAWICKNYDLDENVGKKQMGIYYYYRIMAKALQRYGEQYIVTEDSVKHNWAKELSEQLIKLQKPDGSWVNTHKAFMENDPIMVTSFVVTTLSICHDEMKRHGEVK